MNSSDYYKYATLATAAYVRMGGKSLDGATFADEAANAQRQAGGRLPLSLGEKLFVQSQSNPDVWNILSYYGGDIPAPNAAHDDKSGFGATLFARTENGKTEVSVQGWQ